MSVSNSSTITTAINAAKDPLQKNQRSSDDDGGTDSATPAWIIAFCCVVAIAAVAVVTIIGAVFIVARRRKRKESKQADAGVKTKEIDDDGSKRESNSTIINDRSSRGGRWAGRSFRGSGADNNSKSTQQSIRVKEEIVSGAKLINGKAKTETTKFALSPSPKSIDPKSTAKNAAQIGPTPV